jgi:hypothetical protein
MLSLLMLVGADCDISYTPLKLQISVLNGSTMQFLSSALHTFEAHFNGTFPEVLLQQGVKGH